MAVEDHWGVEPAHLGDHTGDESGQAIRLEMSNPIKLLGDQGTVGGAEAGQDVLVIFEQVIAAEDPEAEPFTKHVGEFIVDVRFDRTGPPTSVHLREASDHVPGDRQVIQADQAVGHDNMGKRSLQTRLGHDAAGAAVAEKVVKPIGAEPGQGAFEQRIDRIVVELCGAVAKRSDRGGQIGPVEEKRFDLLVVGLVLGLEEEIDGMGERRVRDIVKKTGDTLQTIGAEAFQQADRRPGCVRSG